MDEDIYILTLMGIARELSLRDLYEAEVYLAVGLPLTWMHRQKESFQAYLMRNERVQYAAAARADASDGHER